MQLPKVFHVKLDWDCRRLFATFDEAEKYVFDQKPEQEDLLNYLKKNVPCVAYGINSREPIFVFEPEDLGYHMITNSHEIFKREVDTLTEYQKHRHYGSRYLDYEKVEDYPAETKVKDFKACQLNTSSLLRKKYDTILNSSSFSEDSIDDNDPNTLLNFCYNTMIDNLDDGSREAPLRHFWYRWPYVDFFERLEVALDMKGEAGFTECSDVDCESPLTIAQSILIRREVQDALDMYLRDQDAAYDKLRQVNNLLSDMCK